MVAWSTKTRRRLLWAANLSLLAATVASTLVLAISPLATNGPARKNSPDESRVNLEPKHGVRPLEEYVVIYGRDFRKPLYDIKPTPPTEPPKPKLTLTLTGTAVEPGYTFATFQTGSGESKLVGLGETIAGAEVVKITADSVTVSFNGELITLKVSKKEQTP